MRYFLGLTFKQHFSQFKKLDSFRQQFDPKYYLTPTLQMTLLPSFEMEGEIPYDMVAELEELFEDYLVGLTSLEQIHFS